MKLRLCIITLFLCQISYAQNLQQEINEQVWKPFIKGFSTYDADMFMGVHSKDLTRSPRDGKEIYGRTKYAEETKKGNEWSLKNKVGTEIELHFTERIAQEDKAIEVGIYKTTRISPEGKRRSGYGRFHVVMRKEAGLWKILVDTDSSEGNTISEKDFLAAAPME